ncbi:MAG: 2-oxoglutarate ferredoxin oxidoreductase subunit beta [Chloroflexi bacterium]|nr:2-oxoglutarate ferredoxin oxidoreductase subunit beta [Chloroflexota bacterium]
MLRAIQRLGLNQDDVVMVTGIGCSGFIYNYLNFDGFHGTHGRALAVATGIKLANPRLHVIVPMGDGDCAAIGGNHLIHAARRNIDLTAIVINNQTYGMTGGQYSPTTPHDGLAATAPYGNVERPFDLCQVAQGAGASYVARGTTYHVLQLERLIVAAIEHKGFSFVEVVSQCPVQYGRRNQLPSAVDMLRWQQRHTVSPQVAASLSPEQLKDKVVTGELYSREAPEEEYTYRYRQLVERAQGRAVHE